MTAAAPPATPDLAAIRAADEDIGAFAEMYDAVQGGDGPLAGVTVGVKANIQVAGLHWTAGMGLYRDRLAVSDARCVQQLRAAGAVILGTLNMHEAALGATTANAFFGTTHNPHRIGHTPGGSSGGSGAAVAAGLCDVALGTDTMGSVRIPAAYCGVYGLKPTNSAVSHSGLALLEPALDCIGPLARSIDMLERVWPVLVQKVPVPAPPLTRLLLLDELAGVAIEPAAAQAFVAAITALADMPPTALALPHAPHDVRLAGFVASGRWLADALGDAVTRQADQISPELHFMLKAAADRTPAPGVLADTRRALVAALGDDGVLMMPTAPQAAFAHGGRPPANQADFTCLANVAGLPAITIPAGWSDDGLPVAVQLVGPAHSELALFDLARRLDAALGAYRPPAVFGY